MQCLCLPSPRKDDKDSREVFDFTSRKNTTSGKTLRKKKEPKIDVMRKGVETPAAVVVKSPRRVEDRSIFDFTVKKETGTEGHYGRSSYSRRQLMDFTSGKEFIHAIL